MTTDAFTLPVTLAEDFCKPEADAALAEICAPFSSAVPGDVVALTIDYRFYDSASAYPIMSALVRTETGVEMKTLLDIDTVDAASLYKAVVTLQCRLPNIDILSKAFAEMEQADGETSYFSVIALPGLAFIIQDHFEDNVIEGTYEGEPCQDAVEEIYHLIVDRPASAHKTLSLQSRMAEMLALAATWQPILDEDGEVCDIRLPTFSNGLPC